MSIQNRNITELIQSFIKSGSPSKPVLLIEGARQVGKTTAIQMTLQQQPHLYIDLEKRKIFKAQIDACAEFENFEQLLSDTYDFRPGTGKVLVFDEAQESTRLGSFVRYMKEEWSNQTTILSGSLMSRLFREGMREPVGRIHRLLVLPYNFKEYLLAHQKHSLVEAIQKWDPAHPFSLQRHQLLTNLLQDYLLVGGLPEVVHKHADNDNWQEHLLDLKIQYEEDFVRVFGDGKLSLFQRILKRVAETVGYPSKKSSIVAPSEKGYHLLADMLSQVERWHLVHRVDQESYQPTSSGSLLPKRYIFDLGQCQLLNSASRPVIDLQSSLPTQVRTPLGGLLENFAYGELLHLNPESIAGWRHQVNGSEIDFIVKTGHSGLGKTVLPVEIKSSLRFRKDVLSPLSKYLDLYGLSKGFLANLTPGALHTNNKKTIIELPLYCISEISRLQPLH